MAYPNGDRVWITDAQRVTLDLLGILTGVEKELTKRAAAGELITQDHYWAYLAEEVVRNLPPHRHYLRIALDNAGPSSRMRRSDTAVPSQRESTE